MTSSRSTAATCGRWRPSGVAIELNTHLVRPAGTGKVVAPTLTRRPDVAALRLFPGIGVRMLEQLLASPTQGLVLETYGVGNAPSRDPAFLAAISAATAAPREVVVVNCSQCHGGSVRQTLYSTGAALTRCRRDLRATT